MPSDRPQCRKWVHSGERWDTGGHRCGFKAQPGSEFCHLHGGKDAADPTAPPVKPPTVTSRAVTTFTATLAWEPGDGPVIRIPWRDNGHGFVTGATATQVGSDRPRVRVHGVTRLASSGKPGTGHWDKGNESHLGEELTAILIAALRAQGAPE